MHYTKISTRCKKGRARYKRADGKQRLLWLTWRARGSLLPARRPVSLPSPFLCPLCVGIMAGLEDTQPLLALSTNGQAKPQQGSAKDGAGAGSGYTLTLMLTVLVAVLGGSFHVRMDPVSQWTRKKTQQLIPASQWIREKTQQLTLTQKEREAEIDRWAERRRQRDWHGRQ